MHIGLIVKTMGLLLMLFSMVQLPPILVDFIYQQGQFLTFLHSFFLTLFIGFFAWFFSRRSRQNFRVREGILVVVLFWLLLSLFGTMPFLLSEYVTINFTDAFFESMSALTTTGATVLTNLDTMPKALLFYRQQLQWLGGMGIIVLAVAILPMLGVGGMQLYNVEKKGLSQSKLMPRIAQTAKVLWLIYFSLTLLAALSYYVAGMSLFDAISHSFSTVAIGGFSTHDLSIAYFDSAAIELVATIFMLLAGMNFSLHFFAWQRFSLSPYLVDAECKSYLVFLLLLIFFVLFLLWQYDYFDDKTELLRHGIFQVVSIATTTGFVSSPFSAWPMALPIILIVASFVGACVGSTGGGLKVVRVVLLLKQGMNEIKRFLHPNSSVHIRLGKTRIATDVLISVWGFCSLYIFSFVIIVLALMITGLDLLTAFSATAASLNNLGPGLGSVASHYGDINDIAKWILSFTMLLGRLEVLTLITLFHRVFWKY